MNDDKLIRHYSRLVAYGIQQDIVISLKEVSEVLFTSLRHARTLLKNMHALKWLSWTPKAGRNQRSLLFLHQDLKLLKNQIAASLIASGKYERALELVDGEHAVFGQLLQQTSGIVRREGVLHIQLTYHRQFSSLLPHYPQRNSERFLLRQLYSCLVQCDKDGHISPQLAHHWNHNEDASCWTFYLRPKLFFHNEQAIDSTAIVALFQQLRRLPEYQHELSHLQSVIAPHSLAVEFNLQQADWGFAGIIADIRYSIQPASQVESSLLKHASRKQPFASIVGSGAFSLQEQSSQRIRLQAFDKFYGCRALTDSVTIWQVAQKKSSSFAKTLLQTGVIEQSKAQSDDAGSQQYTRIEDGCLLLLMNQKSGLTQLDREQRRYLGERLSTKQLIKQFDTDITQIGAISAKNLLPCWSDIYTRPIEKQNLPELPCHIQIAVFDHLALLECANAISLILEEIGVECKLNIYSFEELQEKSINNMLTESLILSSMNLDDNRPSSIFRWLQSNSVLHQALSLEESQWLRESLAQMRASRPLINYLSELESISGSMLHERLVIPLFHHRQTLQFEGVLKGVSITDWGWPSIQDVWCED